MPCKLTKVFGDYFDAVQSGFCRLGKSFSRRLGLNKHDKDVKRPAPTRNDDQHSAANAFAIDDKYLSFMIDTETFPTRANNDNATSETENDDSRVNTESHIIFDDDEIDLYSARTEIDVYPFRTEFQSCLFKSELYGDPFKTETSVPLSRPETYNASINTNICAPGSTDCGVFTTPHDNPVVGHYQIYPIGFDVEFMDHSPLCDMCDAEVPDFPSTDPSGFGESVVSTF